GFVLFNFLFFVILNIIDPISYQTWQDHFLKGGFLMSNWEHLANMEEIDAFIESNKLAFLYISRPDCSVCHALKPQVQTLLQNYPQIKCGHIDADETEAVAGKF